MTIQSDFWQYLGYFVGWGTVWLYGKRCNHSDAKVLQGHPVVTVFLSSLFSTAFYREDQGFRLVSEQVSHHPPVSAFHAESLVGDFVFHGSIYPKLKFWGKSVEAEPKGTITLELLK